MSDKVFLFAYMSQDRGSDDPLNTFAVQKSIIERFAKKKRILVYKYITDEYDVTQINRPGLSLLIEEIKAVAQDKEALVSLVITDDDRLPPDLVQCSKLCSELAYLDVDIHVYGTMDIVYSDNLLTRSKRMVEPTSCALSQMRFIFNQWLVDREKRKKRLREEFL